MATIPVKISLDFTPTATRLPLLRSARAGVVTATATLYGPHLAVRLCLSPAACPSPMGMARTWTHWARHRQFLGFPPSWIDWTVADCHGSCMLAPSLTRRLTPSPVDTCGQFAPRLLTALRHPRRKI